MQEMITVYIERVCFFIIIAELLVQFAASSKYEKYISLLTGVLCITILIVPIGEFFFENKFNLYLEKTNEFEKELSEMMRDNDIDSRKAEYEELHTEMGNQIIDEAYIQKEKDEQENIEENHKIEKNQNKEENQNKNSDNTENVQKVKITRVNIEAETTERSQ